MAICRRARPIGRLFGPPAGETSTARAMRSGYVDATSMMIGQPSELATNVGRSTPTASRYPISERARPGMSSASGGRRLRPDPGRSGTNERCVVANRAAVGSRYVPEMAKPWTWTTSPVDPGGSLHRWYTGAPSTSTQPDSSGASGRRAMASL